MNARTALTPARQASESLFTRAAGGDVSPMECKRNRPCLLRHVRFFLTYTSSSCLQTDAMIEQAVRAKAASVRGLDGTDGRDGRHISIAAAPRLRFRDVPPSRREPSHQNALPTCPDRGIHLRRGQQDRGDRIACGKPGTLRPEQDARPCCMLPWLAPHARPSPDLGTAGLDNGTPPPVLEKAAHA